MKGFKRFVRFRNARQGADCRVAGCRRNCFVTFETLRNLTKRYETFETLRNVTKRLKPYETSGVIFPLRSSGAACSSPSISSVRTPSEPYCRCIWRNSPATSCFLRSGFRVPMLDSAECDRSSPASLDEREGSAIAPAKRLTAQRLNGGF